MDSTPAPKGWLNPTIIAAIIAAIAAIIVAMVGLIPKLKSEAPKTAEPARIEQHTSGSGSPTVGQAGGNVTITNEQPSTPKKN